MIDKDLKEKWVKALRSGDYKQGKEYLKQFDSSGQASFCCLGVLADLADPDSWADLKQADVGPRRQQIANDDTEFGESCGVPAGFRNMLMSQNDGSAEYFKNAQTFDQIADYIEENL